MRGIILLAGPIGAMALASCGDRIEESATSTNPLQNRTTATVAAHPRPSRPSANPRVAEIKYHRPGESDGIRPVRLDDLRKGQKGADLGSGMDDMMRSMGPQRFSRAFRTVACRKDLSARRNADPASMPALLLEADRHPTCDAA